MKYIIELRQMYKRDNLIKTTIVQNAQRPWLRSVTLQRSHK